MNWDKIQHILRPIGTVLGFGLFVYMIAINFREYTNSSTSYTILWSAIALTFLLYLTVYFLQMVNLKLIYGGMGQKLKLSDAIAGFSLSLIPKYIPGYVWGYFSRADWFERKSAIGGGYSWAATIIELLVTITSGIIVAGIYLLWNKKYAYWFALMILLIPLGEYFILKGLVAKVFKKKPEIIQALEVFRLPQWLIIISSSYFQWIILGVAIWVLGKELLPPGGSIEHQLFSGSYIYARSWVTGFLFFLIPNGLGIREMVLKDLLTTELGIVPGQASLISVVLRLILIFVELVCILIGFLLSRQGDYTNNPNVLLI